MDLFFHENYKKMRQQVLEEPTKDKIDIKKYEININGIVDVKIDPILEGVLQKVMMWANEIGLNGYACSAFNIEEAEQCIGMFNSCHKIKVNYWKKYEGNDA